MVVTLVLLALIDIYLTVLHPRIESSLLSVSIASTTWHIFRYAARMIVPKRRHQLLSYGGSTIVVIVVAVWILLLIFGFALISWTGLGTDIQVSQGQTPTDFITALYYSSYSLTTLGTGDLVPQTSTTSNHVSSDGYSDLSQICLGC
jgi:Ion channel